MVMVIEILLILLIILLVFFFLLLFIPWHLHIIFKNNNLKYDYFALIRFLIFCITVRYLNGLIILELKVHFFSNTFKIFKKNVNEIKSEDEEEIEYSENEKNYEDILLEVKEVYSLLNQSKEDLMDIIKVIVKIVKFDESFSIINLGVSDNNLTIKICNILWTLTAPLYALNFRVLLTPEIDNLILKTDSNIKFNIFLIKLLKIIYLFITRKHLRNLIKYFVNR